MDEGDRYRLTKNRRTLISDLPVDDVLDILLEDEIFDHDDCERVQHGETSKDKARKLLDLLTQRGSKAYASFRKALEKSDCEWLVQNLDTTEIPASSTSTNAGTQPIELNHRLFNRIAKHPAVMRDWKDLGRSLQLEESDLVEINYSHRGSIKECAYQVLIKWTQRAGNDASVAMLLEALRDSGMEAVANELEGK